MLLIAVMLHVQSVKVDKDDGYPRWLSAVLLTKQCIGAAAALTLGSW